ncbi:hypothetical protein [Kozakia baliensis]|uniref:Uncharacterized protein n=1 Tax=Kozakia baliensis TaxID=153496 RepID=A0A1D8USQ3_9PROT|nr:hypothetical protein [Kozakia baliensis]AOX16668.1 hypothetical protein A0U89_05485 [Kozakia baliensis]GBR25947.1 hypothetical protein AA0488_0786 [Kozakia baliensis NRIC 0488]GEL64865.1 hypothetical protein KBA01_21510 [Kozakia baliensis]
MSVPTRGAVIRYSYLWADESAVGAEEGRKDRPSLVLALAVRKEDGLTEILVLAVTHSPPRTETDGVLLSPDIKRHLGLDDAPSWIVTTEANFFVWPGPDLRPIPGRKPATVVYGHVPDGLLTRVARSYLNNRQRQRNRMVRRTE